MPLFSLALMLQTKFVLCTLVAAGALFLLAVFSFSLLLRLDKSPNSKAGKRKQRLQKVLSVTLWGSLGLSLASALATDETTSALQYMTSSAFISSIQISTGLALRVLQWFIVGLSTLFGIGATSMCGRGTVTPSTSKDP